MKPSSALRLARDARRAGIAALLASVPTHALEIEKHQDEVWPPAVNIETLSEDVREEIETVKALALDAPDNASTVGDLGKVYFGYKFNHAAAACFVRAAELDKKSPFRWWYYAGLSYKRASSFGPAIEAFEKAIKLREYPPASVELADLLVETERPRAIEHFQRAIELDPNLASAYAGLGRCAAMDDRPEEAIARFEKAVELEPNFASAHYELAMLLRSVGRMEEAAQHLRLYGQRQSEFTPDDPIKRKLRRTMRASSVMTRRIRNMWDTGRLDEAEALLKNHFLKVNPNEEAVRNLLGHTHMRQERFELAAEQFELILADHPGYVDTRSNLATAYQQMGRRDDAEAVLRVALEQHPDSGTVLHHLALVLTQREETNESLELFARAVAAQPAMPDFRSSYARALAGAKRFDEAAREFRVATELDPRSVDAYAELGCALEQLGNVDGAEAAWRQALALDDTRDDLVVRLAGSHFARAQFELAEKALRDGLAARPKSIDLTGELAWFLATCPDAARRNGPEAVRLADLAVQWTRSNSAKEMDVLAAAYAQVGRFDDAVRAEQRAIRLGTAARTRGIVRRYRERLALYEAAQPFTRP